MRLSVALALGAVMLLIRPPLAPAVAELANTTCYGDLNANPYSGGFHTTDFAVTSAARFVGGGVQLDTALAPLDPQHIILPFDQEVKIKYVYRNAGASHSLGWFYLDQIQSFLDKPATDPTAQLKDQDGDGIPDFWQTQSGTTRPNMGLFKKSSGNTQPDITLGSGYSDAGTYAHIPNLLEDLMGPGKGGMIFKICDDDGDTSVYNNLGPVSDGSTATDGIPDYDVNGDGTIGNEADRTVNLGTLQGGREIVLFAITYYTQDFRKRSLGMTGTGTISGQIMPWFTKNLLNPDSGTMTAGQVLRKQAIGCARDDSSCYGSRGATLGWMDQTAANRLNTTTYGNIVLDDTVNTVQVAADGSVPHFVVNAPHSDPNRWLIAFEDLPAYSGSDFDYNDVVFLVERANGGAVESNLISAEIPTPRLPNTVISKIRVGYTATYPSPSCDGLTTAEIRIYYSVDGKLTWRQMFGGRATANDLTVDVLANGDVGNQLYWKAVFVSPSETCQPKLASLRIGYEAIEHGDFKFAAPIPIANLVFSGSMETPPFPLPEPQPTNNDYSLRGHFRAVRLYDPGAPNITTLNTIWDAGEKLAAKSPDVRGVVTETGASSTVVQGDLSRANAATLLDLVLPLAQRNAMINGRKVYDFTGDNLVNIEDAKFLIEWTRGWEFPSGITLTPTHAALARAWKLGAVYKSSPGIVGPPPRPGWANGTGVPLAMKAAHETFRNTYRSRPSVAVVGAEDGMIHGFAAGNLRYGNDAACSQQLYRGCFAGTTDALRYGDGDELWAYVPSSLLPMLKNNHPATAAYNPAQNPHASVDGAINIEDIYITGSNVFKTIAFATMGVRQPYVTALDMTSGSAVAPIWPNDWTDSDFNGSMLSPSLGLAKVGTVARSLLVVNSGLASQDDDLYLYLIDPIAGTTLTSPVGKIRLNAGTNAAQAFGFAAYPKMVDSDADGLADRIYSVDTLGRIFKYDLTSGQSCMIYAVGESVFSGLAVHVGTAGEPVRLFLGGGPSPDGTGTVASAYHLFAVQDADAVGTCRQAGATQVYKVDAGTSQRVWATPVVVGDDVFFATASTGAVSVCATGTGRLIAMSTAGSGTVPLYSNMNSAPTLTGSPAQTLKVFDKHVLINTVGGETTVQAVGAVGWNNDLPPPPASLSGGPTLDTLIWTER